MGNKRRKNYYLHTAWNKELKSEQAAIAFVDAVRLVCRVEIIKNDAGEMIEDDMRWILLDKENNGAKKYLGIQKVKRQVFPRKKSVIEIGKF